MTPSFAAANRLHLRREMYLSRGARENHSRGARENHSRGARESLFA